MATRKKGKGKRATAKPRGAMADVIDTGHHIWLAGLGALARAQREGPKLFESLVKEGGAFELRQRANVQELATNVWGQLRDSLDAGATGIRDKATETMDNLEGIFQSRVHQALQQLGVPTSQEIEALARKVKELNRSVLALSQSKSTSRSRRSAASHSNAGHQGAAV